MKAGVVVFPGANCDHDAYHVLKHVLGVDVSFVWHKGNDLSDIDLLILPGGFSYGDYLRGGAIAKNSNIMSHVVDFAEKGGLVLGICNGFQVLTEAGLLPGALIRNKGLKFVCKHVNLRVERTDTPFTGLYSAGDVLSIPVAHGEGNLYLSDEEYEDVIDNGLAVFRYCDEDGVVDEKSNFNGSRDNIAGLINRKGNVLGMMPHPERCCEEIIGGVDGYNLFRSALNFLNAV